MSTSPATTPGSPSPASAPAPSRRRAVLARLTRLRNLPAWAFLGAGVLLGAGGGAVYGLVSPVTYTATAYVLAVPGKGGDPASALGFAQAYGRVATQLGVLGDAQVEARVPVATLRSTVTAETSPDAPMIAVGARSGDPEQAADSANAVARALVTAAGHNATDTRVSLVSFSRALAPSAPASPGVPLTSGVGACAGGLLGGLALLARPRRPLAGPAPLPAGALPAPAERKSAEPSRTSETAS
ncbi:lipopolysaccharide biosynthesis protein [Streptomyces sp. NRRL F-5630]|uniref:lipopolysaccharide biosynthesis protein n=1 Tax=Streptomyces sp. NRRL F-5630 TaxID=1463864 RepID=UPI000AADAFC9